MNTIKKIITQIALISAVLLLVSCASNSRWDKGEGVTMAQVYETQMRDSQQSTLTTVRAQMSAIPTADTGIASITASTNSNFVLLPNPTIELYVYPHLVNDNIPVPGYSTQFTLYTEVHYALPGEVPVKGELHA